MFVVVSLKVISTPASHASLAVTAGHEGTAGQVIVVLPAQVIIGGAMSLTVIVALQIDVLPQSSIALQVRV
jgi:hypothetical protein